MFDINNGIKLLKLRIECTVISFSYENALFSVRFACLLYFMYNLLIMNHFINHLSLKCYVF